MSTNTTSVVTMNALALIGASYTIYTTSSGTTKTSIDSNYVYPYTNDLDITSPASTVISNIVPNTISVTGTGGYWTHSVNSNTAYGYASTRCSVRVLNGTTVVNNNTLSVTARTSSYTATLTNYTFASYYTYTNSFKVGILITFTRGTSGADNRSATVTAAQTNIAAAYDLYDYYYYYYAVNNSTRGYSSSSYTNGSYNREGTNVSTTFTPNTGYYIDYINDTVSGNVTLNTSSPYVYYVASYATRTATCYFGAYTYYVTMTNNSGGTLSANASSGEYGFNSLITFTPSYAYEVDYFTVGGTNHPSTDLSANTYTISNITANVAVYGNFRRISNMQACIGGTLKRLDMYACIGGTLKPIVTKFCVGGVLRS